MAQNPSGRGRKSSVCTQVQVIQCGGPFTPQIHFLSIASCFKWVGVHENFLTKALSSCWEVSTVLLSWGHLPQGAGTPAQAIWDLLRSTLFYLESPKLLQNQRKRQGRGEVQLPVYTKAKFVREVLVQRKRIIQMLYNMGEW